MSDVMRNRVPMMAWAVGTAGLLGVASFLLEIPLLGAVLIALSAGGVWRIHRWRTHPEPRQDGSTGTSEASR
jgi:hypothetical protein